MRSHKLLELQQIADADEGSPFPKHDLWVEASEVRPLPGHKVNDGVVAPQQDALAIRRVPHTNADELAPAEWMERMRYPDKLRPNDRTGCILR